jgi:hypothetical protein
MGTQSTQSDTFLFVLRDVRRELQMHDQVTEIHFLLYTRWLSALTEIV